MVTRKRQDYMGLMLTAGKLFFILAVIQCLMILSEISSPYHLVQNYIIHSSRVRIPEVLNETLKDEIMKQLENSSGASCQHKPWEAPDGVFNLKQDENPYFVKFGGGLCLTEGTNISSSTKSGRCVCRSGWHGNWCSIPDVVNFSNYPFQRFPLQLREKPRRIVSALPFNLEFEMLEARFGDLGDIVDVFMILESNYTAYGDPKPLRLLERLKGGQYSGVACKIDHVFLPYFPKEAHRDGWIADSLLRNYIGEHGVVKQLRNYTQEDIFWLSDADELPSRQAMLFLKVHDGYPEPIKIHLQKHTFGFFWRPEGGRTTHVTAGVTFGLLTRVFSYHAIVIRRAASELLRQSSKLNAYLKTGAKVREWSVGREDLPGGWHCSWCGPPEHILVKLVSAQNGDFPRWGDYPSKRNLDYIKGLIRQGMWFNDKIKFEKTEPGNKMYAPPHILKHSHLYKHILYNPYESRTTSSQPNGPLINVTVPLL